MGTVRPLVEQGLIALVPGSPEFSYPSYMVHSTKADESIMARIRLGLRAAAEASA
jgi:LysR family transcriptional regulator, flagellar master operon regulator